MDEKLTLKEKDRIAKKIYKSYQRAQLDILYLTQHYNYYPQVDMFRVKDSSTVYQKADSKFIHQLERKQELESFVGIVNQIHTHLSRDAYSFIENEYLNFYDPSWWTPYFSRASYYRMKHKALDEFLECMRAFWSEKELLRLMK
ncbi:MG284/MPN403 family protein [Candidatus Stoquefichus massiliensis]|uniref:MG284/MPN403 family protein n=1 Tax=Candidatus Stoquefichus massiliensis TaxID=1470350 RepID=UPI0004883D3B|nr:hypothetical protein [Candidatus Stoquefichus massiliensis]